RHTVSFAGCLRRIGRPARSTLFPYTTLFRSGDLHGRALGGAVLEQGAQVLDGDVRLGLVADRHDELGHAPVLGAGDRAGDLALRSEEHTSELQSRENLVCRLLLEKKKNTTDL